MQTRRQAVNSTNFFWPNVNKITIIRSSIICPSQLHVILYYLQPLSHSVLSLF
jgi:hypothetical protein